MIFRSFDLLQVWNHESFPLCLYILDEEKNPPFYSKFHRVVQFQNERFSIFSKLHKPCKYFVIEIFKFSDIRYLSAYEKY